MTIGTKSVLFGAHCFFIHPFIVALAWWKVYGFPWDWRLWVAFFVHDLGYWGKENIDGPEGETHPELGARIMNRLFDKWNPDDFLEAVIFSNIDLWVTHAKRSNTHWYRFTKYHSRYLAKRDRVYPSPLCVADKLATALEPYWLYFPRVRLTGELDEYMRGEGERTPGHGLTPKQWFSEVQRICREWAEHHKELKPDRWTGTDRDLAKKDLQRSRG